MTLRFQLLELILALSIALQFIAAGIALRLIPMTRHKTAWLLISAALVLMATRRVIGMFGLFNWLSSYTLVMELIALAISVLMILGVLRIKGLFERQNQFAAIQQHFCEILENTSDFVGSMDPKGTITYLNRAARRMAGLSEPTNTRDSLNVEDIFPEATLETLTRTAIPECDRSGFWRGTTTLVNRENGTLLTLSQVLIAHPRDAKGQIPSYSTISRDITDRIEIQKQLTELGQSRERLIAVIAHDLRGPIGNTLSLIKLLREDLSRFSREEIDESLAQVEEALTANSDMMNRLLQWTRSQAQSAEVRTETIGLCCLLQCVMDSMHVAFVHKQLRLETRLPSNLRVESDPDIVRTVMRNFLSNAIKFTPRGGRILISAEESDGRVTICVEDGGPGMSAEVLKSINDGIPVTSSTGSDGESGNGLGLSLCHALVRQLQQRWPECRFTASSVPSQGTRMELVLHSNGSVPHIA